MASLTRKKDCKNWIANITLPEGKRTSRSTGTSDKKLAQKIADTLEEATRKAKKSQFVERDARAALNEILKRAGEETMNSETVEQFLRGWVESQANEGTKERYGHVVNVLLKHLGKKSSSLLPNITYKDAENFVKIRKAANLASKTIRLDAKILSIAFNLARKLGFIEVNPFEKALAKSPIKVTSSRRIEFTPDQVSEILKSAQGEWKTVILFGYFTGARLVDCATMRWSNINFDKCVIDYTETKRGKRVVMPILPAFEAYLHSIASTDSTNPYVTPKLSQMRSSGRRGLSRGFTQIMGLAGIDPQTGPGQGKRKFSKLSFHSLRHTTITLLANNGIDQETRMALVGQSTKKINSDYTHLDLDKLRGAMQKLPTLNFKPAS